MTDVKVDSTDIDNYVKLFLSACKRLHERAEERFEQKAEDEVAEANSKKKKASRKKKKQPKQAKLTAVITVQPPVPKSRKRKRTVPFFVSAANYQCLPNLKEQIDLFGCMRNIWEGLSEGFIKYIKHEMTTMRHNPQFLATVLTKLL